MIQISFATSGKAVDTPDDFYDHFRFKGSHVNPQENNYLNVASPKHHG